MRMFNWIKDWKQWREEVDARLRKEPVYDKAGVSFGGFGFVRIGYCPEITVNQAITALADYLEVDINALTKTVIAKKKEKKAHKD
jgi:hypothetical protein